MSFVKREKNSADINDIRNDTQRLPRTRIKIELPEKGNKPYSFIGTKHHSVVIYGRNFKEHACII